MSKINSCSTLLKKFGYISEVCRYEWAITGSFCLYMHDYDIIPNDIDIICERQFCDFLQLNMNQYEKKNFCLSLDKDIYSYFGEYNFDKTNIQVMCEVWNRDKNNVWHFNDFWHSQIEIKNINGINIPILSIDHEIYISKIKENISRVDMIYSNMA